MVFFASRQVINRLPATGDLDFYPDLDSFVDGAMALVPTDKPKRDVFGCMAGTAEIIGDIEAPKIWHPTPET
jgi:hypothetical protein